MKVSLLKTYRDLSHNKLKTIFILSTLFISNVVFGIVVMISNILTPEIYKAYYSSIPAEVIIKCDPYQNDILNKLKVIPEIDQVGGRANIGCRLKIDNTTLNTNLVVFDQTNQVSILKNKDGSLTLPDLKENEFFLERAIQNDVQKLPGDTLTVLLNDNQMIDMTLADYIYDPISEPYLLEGDVFAFINQATYENITGDGRFNEIHFTVKGNYAKAYNETVGNKAMEKLNELGIVTYEMQVKESNEFYASLALDAINIILIILGILILIMTSFLIINIFNSMMLQQVKIIGIMKAIGGSTMKIACMYFMHIFIIGIITFLLSLPISFLISKTICQKLAYILNVSLTQTRMPSLLPIVLFLSTIVVPLLVVRSPIIKTTKATVYDALTTNLKGGHFNHATFINKWMSKLSGLSMIVRYALRNQIKDRMRTILTLTSLILSSCILITSLNLYKSLTSTIHENRGLFPDVILTLDDYYDSEKLISISKEVNEINEVECWAFQPALYLQQGTHSSKRVLLNGIPQPSKFFNQSIYEDRLISGRLLRHQNKNEILISNHLLNMYPHIKVGDTITIQIKQKHYDFIVVGIIGIFGQPESPTLFVDYTYLNNVLEGENMVRDLRFNTTLLNTEQQINLINKLEKALNHKNIHVSEINTGDKMFEQFSASTIIVVTLLLTIAILILFVSAIGLTGNLNINIMERTFEFAIMKALGSGPQQINRLIIIEGLALTSIAWIIGNIAAIPLTNILAKYVGKAILGTPAAYQINIVGLLIGLIVALIITFTTSIIPCRNLNKIATKDMLVYE